MSHAEKLANFFRRAPGRWFDGRELATVAGCYGWRSRVSDVRRPPYNLTIENRQRLVTQPGGTYTISEYRLVPAGSVIRRPEFQAAMPPVNIVAGGRVKLRQLDLFPSVPPA